MLQREALRKQKDDLLQENLQLRRLLRQYLEGKAIQALPLHTEAITQQVAAGGHAHLATASPPRL